MKPLRLEITGLNSFRNPQIIEFEALLQDGLFGIFGPTGSGKSSILDAMTLALYGKVKRAPGGRAGIINAREKQCSVSFTFETANAEGRKCYTVERTFRRKNSSGVETIRVRLLECKEGERIPLAEKQGEVDERMQQIVGISVDDFLRAVVLPQGSFAEFLGLPPRERAAAMQRLFGLQNLGTRLNAHLKAHGVSRVR